MRLASRGVLADVRNMAQRNREGKITWGRLMRPKDRIDGLGFSDDLYLSDQQLDEAPV